MKVRRDSFGENTNDYFFLFFLSLSSRMFLSVFRRDYNGRLPRALGFLPLCPTRGCDATLQAGQVRL